MTLSFSLSEYVRDAVQTVRMMPEEPIGVDIKVVNLAHCPSCRSNLVTPVSHEQLDFGYWLHLRCPNCDEEFRGVWDDYTVGAYDEHLAEATDMCIDMVDLLQQSIEEDV